ncbi:hypothetical protein H0H92_012019 [Tricholoma furcatifolium]|nr:hypothetical protein H0H92_012019 [Tricholoma furcatifolium]
MPSLELSTNVKVSDPKAFALEFSKFSAETLKKPEKYITVKYSHNEILTFQGTLEPAFTMLVISLDNLNPEANEEYSKAFFEFFSKKLGVKGDRGYIYEGTTFGTIFGGK